jgi:hypothetical protein
MPALFAMSTTAPHFANIKRPVARCGMRAVRGA